MGGGMSLWPIAVVAVALVLVAWMAKSYLTNRDMQDVYNRERDTAFQDLRASYQTELADRDAQIERHEATVAEWRAEIEWARAHVANREREIAQLKASAPDEILECLAVVVDPAFVP